MYENELYLLIDQIFTMITLSIWVIVIAYLFIKYTYKLHKLDGYMDHVLSLKPYNVEYQKALLDYKFKVKELKRRK